MSDWRVLIPKCFTAEDLVFAATPAELARAWQLRAEASEAGISHGLIESAIEEWLHTETSNTGQLYEQMSRVRSFFDS